MLSHSSVESQPWIPRVVRRESSDGWLRLELVVPADLSCFAGHFPGRPILPGYLLVSWALQAGAELAPGRPSELRKLKFLRPVQPGGELILELSARPERADRIDFAFADRSAQPICSGAVHYAHED